MNDSKTKEAVAEFVREFISSNTGLSGTATSGVKERRGRRRQLVLSRALATRHLRASTKKRLRRDGRRRQYLLRGAELDVLTTADYDDPYSGDVNLKMEMVINKKRCVDTVTVPIREMVSTRRYEALGKRVEKFIIKTVIGEGLEQGRIKHL